MIPCKVITKQLVINRRTHQYNPLPWVRSDHTLDRQQNKICVDVSFMHFVEDYELILFKEGRIQHQTLKENPICHKYYFAPRMKICLSANLITNDVLVAHLP